MRLEGHTPARLKGESPVPVPFCHLQIIVLQMYVHQVVVELDCGTASHTTDQNADANSQVCQRIRCQ